MKLEDGLKFGALALFSVIIGLGLYTFIYAKGHSYMTNDPKACVNCHVMKPHYDAWQKSSHHAVAACNDCHTPKGLVPKYFTKALNGWNHSVAFTTGNFKEPIEITARNRRITEQTCRSCHAQVTHHIETRVEGRELSCIRCHSTVGHIE